MDVNSKLTYDVISSENTIMLDNDFSKGYHKKCLFIHESYSVGNNTISTIIDEGEDYKSFEFSETDFIKRTTPINGNLSSDNILDHTKKIENIETKFFQGVTSLQKKYEQTCPNTSDINKCYNNELDIYAAGMKDKITNLNVNGQKNLVDEIIEIESDEEENIDTKGNIINIQNKQICSIVENDDNTDPNKNQQPENEISTYNNKYIERINKLYMGNVMNSNTNLVRNPNNVRNNISLPVLQCSYIPNRINCEVNHVKSKEYLNISEQPLDLSVKKHNVTDNLNTSQNSSKSPPVTEYVITNKLTEEQRKVALNDGRAIKQNVQTLPIKENTIIALKKSVSKKRKRNLTRIGHKIKFEDDLVKCSLCSENLTKRSKNQVSKCSRCKSKEKGDTRKILFQCWKCSEYFHTKVKLKKHQIIHIREIVKEYSLYQTEYDKKSNQNVRLETNPNEDFICELCGKQFASIFSFTYHTEMHKQTQKVYKCHLCEKQYIREYGFTNHTMTEKCFKCGNTFKCKTSFIWHTKVCSMIVI